MFLRSPRCLIAQIWNDAISVWQKIKNDWGLEAVWQLAQRWCVNVLAASRRTTPCVLRQNATRGPGREKRRRWFFADIIAAAEHPTEAFASVLPDLSTEPTRIDLDEFAKLSQLMSAWPRTLTQLACCEALLVHCRALKQSEPEDTKGLDR
jgi:hypothetical protein